MPRPAIYRNPKRVNIVLEGDLHSLGQKKASDHGMRGGFSEYVARLIAADRSRKGRALFSSSVSSRLRRAA